MAEIADSRADVLTLQEADSLPDQDADFWPKSLASLGYDCWFERALRDNAKVGDENDKKPYGLLLAWKRDTFECVARELVDFFKELHGAASR